MAVDMVIMIQSSPKISTMVQYAFRTLMLNSSCFTIAMHDVELRADEIFTEIYSSCVNFETQFRESPMRFPNRAQLVGIFDSCE